tara:strand:+ start:532 stop:2064 length:1533 start_codon:yes stop_codon:yes gene_type:complete
MSILRYSADKDNTISDAYKSNLSGTATGSNMGLADALHIFSIYGQVSGSTGFSKELSRAIIKFPVTGTNSIKEDRDNGAIPASGSVSFYLNLYNAVHSDTLPKEFTINVYALDHSWNEGDGLDMVSYKDIGTSNWEDRLAATAWTSTGGSFQNTSSVAIWKANQYFTNGTEDLSINVTPYVESWIKGDDGGGFENYGFLVALAPTEESASQSYYTKHFYARSSEYFFKRPNIEARWNSAETDNRGNFYFSSSLASAANNINTLYLYNYVRGQLQDIPDLGTDKHVYLSLFSGSLTNAEPTGAPLDLSPDNDGRVRSTCLTVVTGGIVSTGIYTASFAFTGSDDLTDVFDVWFTGSLNTSDATEATIQFHTGNIIPKILDSSNINPTTQYVTKIVNLKPSYTRKEEPKMRVFARKKDWSPTIYTIANSEIQTDVIDKAYFKVVRVIDNLEVISYGTGSDQYTKLSYDVSGNYFDLDMSLLESGYMYEISLTYYLNGVYKEQPQTFKFRVED